MNPLLVAQLRRHWQIVGAVLMFAVFSAANLLAFEPTVRRYEAALKHAGDLGTVLSSAPAPHVLPPRVFALLTENSLPPDVAMARDRSGALASELQEDLTRMASKHGMEVVAAEPGTVIQQPASVEVRAHLKVRCSYAQMVGFLDDLAASGQLFALDRFKLDASDTGHHTLELWLSRLILKQTTGHV